MQSYIKQSVLAVPISPTYGEEDQTHTVSCDNWRQEQ